MRSVLEDRLREIAAGDNPWLLAVDLGKEADPELIRRLGEIARSGTAVGETAALALGTISSTDGDIRAAMRAEILMLVDSANEETAASAIIGLRYCSAPGDAELVITRVQDPSPVVRHAIAVVLPWLVARDAEYRGRPTEAVVDALLELMHDPDDEVQNWATFAVGRSMRLDRPEFREPLKRIADNDEPSEVRCEALYALVRLGDEDALVPCMSGCDLEREVLIAAGKSARADVVAELLLVRANEEWDGPEQVLHDAIESAQRNLRQAQERQ